MKNGKRIWEAIGKIGQLKADEEFMDYNEKHLLYRGIAPIQRPKEITKGKYTLTSVIGNGSYQTAYEVLYKGKRAVAKVQSGISEDAKKTQALWEIRNALPEKLRKHIMEVYEYIDFGGTRKCVIVEYLKPLEKGLRVIFGDYAAWNTSMDRLKILYRNKSLLKQLIDASIDKVIVKRFEYYINESIGGKAKDLRKRNLINNGIMLRNAIINEMDEDKFADILEEYENTIYEYINVILSGEIGKRIKEDIELGEIKGGVGKILKDKQKKDIDNLGKELGQNIYNEVMKYLGSPFPSFKSEMARYTKKIEDKRVRDFLACINYLDKMGYEWGDLHAENVMQRENGDLVIADPGYFIVPSLYKEEE